MIKQGDIVGRKSYQSDILFQVKEFFKGEGGREFALLKGLDLRLIADAPLEDLEIKSPFEIFTYKQCWINQKVSLFHNFRAWQERGEEKERGFFFFPGRSFTSTGTRTTFEKA